MKYEKLNRTEWFIYLSATRKTFREKVDALIDEWKDIALSKTNVETKETKGFDFFKLSNKLVNLQNLNYVEKDPKHEIYRMYFRDGLVAPLTLEEYQIMNDLIK